MAWTSAPRRPVRETLNRPASEPIPGLALEESQRLRAVTHQHILGLLIMIQHHLVRLTTHARLLVTAKRGVRRIGVIAVGPHASGLDASAKAVGHVQITRPHAGT